MYATNQFRKGLKIELDGVPYEIIHFEHVSPGKGGAFTRTKLRNLLTQKMDEKTFKSGDKVDRANTEERDMQFLYQDAEGFHFMNTSTYEQVALMAETLGDEVGFLQENLIIKVLFFNERAISIELPNFVELKVVETEPSIKGDTVSGGGKPAQLETGASVSVPFHIQEGDVIKVDTRTREYSEKVNK